MTRPTYAEVDLSAIRQNVTNIKNNIPKTAAVCAVVKADAYGHGSLQTAYAALRGGAAWLAVAIPEEAIPLREAGIKAPLLVLGGIAPAEAELSVAYHLEQCVYTEEIIRILDEEAQRQHKKARVHIKVDTGMGRIGIRKPEEMRKLLSCIETCPNIVLSGMFTHFSVSDIVDKAYTLEQNEKFKEFIQQVRSAGHDPILHAANSAASIDMPELSYHMVRPGIAIYGLYPSEEVAKSNVELYPAMRIISHVSHVKTLDAGESVSYGRTYSTEGETVVATIPIGYGDGFRRILSNRGDVLVHGKRARILGRVCMDQTMVDVTGIEGVKTGDEVVIIGKQGKEEITANEMAELTGTINYEVVLAFLPRVQRIYTGGDAL
jgi:alanine racemase